MKKYNDFLKWDKKDLFNKILAHTKENSTETLEEHSSLTLRYFNQLLSTFQLNNVIDKLISDVFLSKNKEMVREFINYIIYFHDIGKINPLYQREKLRNTIELQTTLKNSHHSKVGYVLVISLMYNRFNKIINLTDLVYLFVLASVIKEHHTNLKNISHIFKEQDLLVPARELFDSIFDIEKTGTGKINGKYTYLFIKDKWEKIQSQNNKADSEQIEKRESFFYLYKLLYSLLIISDYYATLEFKKEVEYLNNDFNLLSKIKDKVVNNFYNNPHYPYNNSLNLKEDRDNIQKQEYYSSKDIGELRTKILHDANSYFDKIDWDNKKIFYLRLPTGSGKTNISISLAINLINKKKVKNLNRVYYVFPFINIIEQNYKAIRDSLQLNEEEISEIYSNSEWLGKEESEEEKWKYYLNNEFLNYPINVMSNVNFFNTFIKSGKAQNYKLHNLANSLVIIDEIQSLNDKDWTMFNDFIAYSSRKLNIYYIIMSATLPRLNNLLKDEEKYMDYYFINIFPEEVENQIFNHPLLKKRVTLRLRNDVQKREDITKLLEENFPIVDSPKVLIVVNTIKDSIELYALIGKWNQVKKRFDEILLLNSTILPFRRREIIDKIKSSDKSILLISTQAVEAGVDIDCDYGIRDFAIFDSIEQVAGRINRNCNKKYRDFFLDIILLKENNKERWNIIYKNSERGQVIRNEYLMNEKLQEFIENRNILNYYDKVISIKNDKNNSKIQKNDRDTVESIRKLNFEDLNKKNVISQQSISFFVPMSLTKEDLIKYPFVFSEREKRFLKNSLDIGLDNGLETELLWDYYKKILKEEKSITEKKIDLKRFNSVITKFIFSVSCNKKYMISIDFNEGVILLDKTKLPYTIEKGLDTTKLREELLNNAEFW